MKYAFMNERDLQIINAIMRHYFELQSELSQLKDFDSFCENKLLNKAIKLDLLQIGENVNHLSKEAQAQISKRDLVGVIDVRNQVAHGYVKLKDDKIWNTINYDLPNLIKQIQNIK